MSNAMEFMPEKFILSIDPILFNQLYFFCSLSAFVPGVLRPPPQHAASTAAFLCLSCCMLHKYGQLQNCKLVAALPAVH